MDSRHFLWPRARKPSPRHWLGGNISASEIEDILDATYPEATSVLFSSARAGLTAILEAEGTGRPDLVWCPDYSSHCVLEAIARVGTPVTQTTSAPKAALLYHQWGHRHRETFDSSTIVIDDSVDTLFRPGYPVFSQRGQYALWSLPKVFGVAHGGIVFCRCAENAARLRSIRDARGTSSLQALLRLTKNPRALLYWNGAEASQGGLPPFALRQIREAISAIEETVVAAETRLGPIWRTLGKTTERHLPTAIPLRIQENDEFRSVWSASNSPFSCGLRNFNTAMSAPDGTWERVAPLPVHKDVPNDFLEELTKRIRLESALR